MARRRSSIPFGPGLVLLYGPARIAAARVAAQTTLAPADGAQAGVATLEALDGWLDRPRPSGRVVRRMLSHLVT
jgi:hypothetical protein